MENQGKYKEIGKQNLQSVKRTVQKSLSERSFSTKQNMSVDGSERKQTANQ